jgi:phosphatidylserine synthase
MSKLSIEDKFLDLSDYGRGFGRFLAGLFQNTRVTPIHVTLMFGVSGLLAIGCIIYGYYLWASFFMILKSGIDAADGELARLNKTPSYVGRYLDSIFDIVLNFGFLLAIGFVSKTPLWLVFIAFIGLQLQGTLYNYYYVILRNTALGGDTTSKIFEYKTPRALPGERQETVNVLFKIYQIVYGPFDRVIHFFDANAYKVKRFPNIFMTLLSVFGLGFQLLIIAVMMPLGWMAYIAPFFVVFTFFIFVLIGYRKFFIKAA